MTTLRNDPRYQLLETLQTLEGFMTGQQNQAAWELVREAQELAVNLASAKVKPLFIAVHLGEEPEDQTLIGVFDDLEEAQRLLIIAADMDYMDFYQGEYVRRTRVVDHWKPRKPGFALILPYDASGQRMEDIGYVMAADLNDFHNPGCEMSLEHTCDDLEIWSCDKCGGHFCGQFGAADEYFELCDDCALEAKNS